MEKNRDKLDSTYTLSYFRDPRYYGHFIENNSKLKNQHDTPFSESIVEGNHYKVQNGSGYNYTTHPDDFIYLIDIID